MQDPTFEEALKIVADKCGIDQEHWKQANDSVKYIDTLFIKIAKVLR